jgi:hypothetical protein
VDGVQHARPPDASLIDVHRRVQFAGRAEADCVLQPLLRQRN